MSTDDISREPVEPTQEELDEVFRWGVGYYGYQCSRSLGASHQECQDAHTLGVDLWPWRLEQPMRKSSRRTVSV